MFKHVYVADPLTGFSQRWMPGQGGAVADAGAVWRHFTTSQHKRHAIRAGPTAVHFHACSDSIACAWQLNQQPGCRIFKLSVDCEII